MWSPITQRPKGLHVQYLLVHALNFLLLAIHSGISAHSFATFAQGKNAVEPLTPSPKSYTKLGIVSALQEQSPLCSFGWADVLFAQPSGSELCLQTDDLVHMYGSGAKEKWYEHWIFKMQLF